jgi:transcription elongation factor Elf1
LRAASCLTSIVLDAAKAGRYMRLMNNPAPHTKFFTCPHCPTEYWVSYKETLTRDSGSAYCKACRRKMIEWNDYAQPSFSPVLDSLNEDRLPPPRAGRQRY